jgi:hypothetical protein
MNTAFATRSTALFTSKEDYLAFKAHWKDLARQKAITKEDAALRALVLNQDPLRSMPPTTNPVRLANGALCASGIWTAMASVSYAATMAAEHLAYAARPADAPAARAPRQLPSLAQAWLKHGVSLELMASLKDKANRAHLGSAA